MSYLDRFGLEGKVALVPGGGGAIGAAIAASAGFPRAVRGMDAAPGAHREVFTATLRVGTGTRQPGRLVLVERETGGNGQRGSERNSNPSRDHSSTLPCVYQSPSTMRRTSLPSTTSSCTAGRCV